MLVLTVAKGPDRGVKFELRAKNSVIIGRNSVDLKLSDIMISRYHARLKEVDGRWYVRDLGSRNGTKLNGERLLRTQALREGDLIATGLTVLEFHVVPDPADKMSPVSSADGPDTRIEDDDEPIAMAQLPRVGSRPAEPPSEDRLEDPPAAKANLEVSGSSIVAPFEQSAPADPADAPVQVAAPASQVAHSVREPNESTDLRDEPPSVQQFTEAVAHVPSPVDVPTAHFAAPATPDIDKQQEAISPADLSPEPPALAAAETTPQALFTSVVEPPVDSAEPAFLSLDSYALPPVAASEQMLTAPAVEVAMQLPALQELTQSIGDYYHDESTLQDEVLFDDASVGDDIHPATTSASESINAAASEAAAEAPAVEVASEPSPVDLVSVDEEQISRTSIAAPLSAPVEPTGSANESANIAQREAAHSDPMLVAPPAETVAPLAEAVVDSASPAAVAQIGAAPIQASTEIAGAGKPEEVSAAEPVRGGEQAASEWFAAVEAQVQVVESQGWDVEPGEDDDLIGLSAITDPPDTTLDADARARLYWDDDDHWSDDDDQDITAAAALGVLDLQGLERELSQPLDLGTAPEPAPVPLASTRCDRVNAAAERIAARDFAEAEAMLRGLQDELPTDPRSLEMLVMLLEFTARHDEAGALLESLLRQFPRDKHVLQLANLFHQRANGDHTHETLDASVGALFSDLSDPDTAGLAHPSGTAPVAAGAAAVPAHSLANASSVAEIAQRSAAQDDTLPSAATTDAPGEDRPKARSRRRGSH